VRVTVSDEIIGINLEYQERTFQEELRPDLFSEPLDFYRQEPFDPESFRAEQSFLLSKVEQAFAAMKEDLLECEEDRELLSSTFQIDIWERLIVEMRETLECIGSTEPFRIAIYRCAVTFYKDLMDPIRSKKMFNYLLQLDPLDPDFWGAYGLCLIEMSEQCICSSFDMERRSVFCFIRAARLSLAHLISRDAWLDAHDEETALRLAQEYYYNASDAYPNHISRKGIYLTLMLKKMNAVPEKDSFTGREIIYEGEDLTREIQEVIALLPPH